MGSVINRGTKERPLWYCKYRDLDGKWKQKATHQPTKAAALRFVAEIEGRIARGQIGMPGISDKEQRQKAITVAELAVLFLSEYDRPTLRNRAKYMDLARSSCKKRLFPYPIAKLAAASVRKIDVMAYRDSLRRAGYMNKTINHALGWLRRIYNWADEMEHINCRNPVSHVERMPETPSTECYTREQVERLLSPAHCHPMVATALYTGMRKGELFGLSWDCVRFELGAIEVKRSFDGPPKNGKPRTIPLHPELAPILQEWQACCPLTPQRMVFPVRSFSRYRPGCRQDMGDVRAVLEAAGCPGDLEHPWHAMRHTFATMFCESGGHRSALESILGHSSGGNRVTASYVHVSLTYLARELAKMSLQLGQPAKLYRLNAYRQQTA